MKIHQIILSETTTAGAVATVAKPMGETQKRPSVRGLEPAEKIMSGKAKKKGPYANSLSEGKVKQLAMDLKGGKDGLTDVEFKKKYGKTKEEMRKAMQQKPEPVKEAKLDEDDLILVPGKGLSRRSGFIPHDPDKAEHEGQTLKNSLHTIIRVATHLNKELSTQDNFPEWVSEKIGAIKHMMVTVMDYVISDKEMHGRVTSNETGGVIAAGGVGEGKFTVNRNTGARLHPRTGAELPPKEKPLTMKDMFRQPKSTAPKLTLDDVWRKVEDVVGRIFPDGDPIDYLAPWLEKHGIRDFKIGEILDRAAKKNGYKDLYDYYDSMKDQYARDNVEEAGYQSPHAKLAQLKAKYDAALKSPNPNPTTLRKIRDQIIKLEFDLGIKEGVAEGGILKSIKRGMQGWDKNAVGPSGEKLGDPKDIVKRAKAMDTDTAKKIRAGLDAASDHSPAGLQKRVLDRKLKGVAEGAKVDRMVQHIKKSEIKTGKSKDEAENIAWATVNKRGYLDNKNKKKAK